MGYFRVSCILGISLRNLLILDYETLLSGNFGAKSILIFVKDACDGLFPDGLIFNIILAIIAIAVPTVTSTGKAFAVQFQTTGVLAIAIPPTRVVLNKSKSSLVENLRLNLIS